ncbi:alpha/beta hydrolase [Actinospica robiniae]|uniref:alpha/beta hydrolase n=1 Tax=Actinospica robiniae TaxID=304901 RepID=UPI00040A12E7|nr:alpha/beta hydrolase [Actinospica robiniae]
MSGTSRTTSPTREAVSFTVAGARLAAWHYPGTDGSCVVMAGGFAVTKEPATDLFAARFNAAGFGVLAFDYRHLGESEGEPRQVMRVREQLADWQGAIDYAATLPGVDPARIAVWGFSATGGHIFQVAARNPRLAAAIAQTPNAGGMTAARAAMRFQTPAASLRLTARGVLDALGGRFGRAPLTVPLWADPGTVAVLTTPDVVDSQRALDPENKHAQDWRKEAAARSVLRLAAYRPGRAAARISCPLQVIVCADDKSAYPPAAIAAARRAKNAELVELPGGHYAPFLAAHEEAAEAQIKFLTRRLRSGH